MPQRYPYVLMERMFSIGRDVNGAEELISDCKRSACAIKIADTRDSGWVRKVQDFNVSALEMCKIEWSDRHTEWVVVFYDANHSSVELFVNVMSIQSSMQEIQRELNSQYRNGRMVGLRSYLRRYYCNRCGVREAHSIMGREYRLCRQCSNGDIRPCDQCGRELGVSSVARVVNRARICDECFRAAGYQVCNRCESIIEAEGRIVLQEDGIDQVYCNTCAPIVTRQCDECGEPWGTGGLREIYRDGMVVYLCNRCRDIGTPVMNYTYRPTWQVKGDGPLYYGVELEVEVRDRSDTIATSVLLEFSRRKELFYIKVDASVRGWELVTHPFSLKYHRDSFPWGGVLKSLRLAGCRSHSHSSSSSCGLHVHVSRGVLSEAGEVRLGYFVYSNKNRLEILARRAETSYAAFKVKQLQRGESLRSEAHHYDAVNFANRDTIEIRVFKGTLNPNTLIASLELCDAMVRFCGEVGDEDIREPKRGWELFLEWVNTQEYVKLVKYMQNRGVV